MEGIESLKSKREDILRIAANHGVTSVRVFGSFARGEAGPESDIDFLVEVGPKPGSWFPAGLIIDLENLLGRKIDIATERGLRPILLRRVLKDAVPL